MRIRHIATFAETIRTDPVTLAREYLSARDAIEHEFQSEEARAAYVDLLAALGRFQHTAGFARALEQLDVRSGAPEEALRQDSPDVMHYNGFASMADRSLSSQICLTLSRDELMVTDDAIARRVEGLEARLEVIDRETSEGLFVAKAIDRLSTARDRVGSALKGTR